MATDLDYDDDLDTDDNEPVEPVREDPNIRTLRRQAKKSGEFEQRATAAERELAVFKAGLADLSDVQRKALLSTHEGDLTPDGLKATATALGFVKTAEAEPEVPAEELAQHDRLASAAAGAGPAPKQQLEEAIANAKTPEELTSVLEQAGAATRRTSQ